MVDMDDTIADFKGAKIFKDMGKLEVSRMHEPGFFKDLMPVEGALVAVRELIAMGFDVQILTQPVANSAHSYSEKVQWIGLWFPELINKINMVQDKGLIKGDYLIDDNKPKWMEKFENNGGIFVHFRYDELEHKYEWELILKFFKNVNPDKD